MTEYHLVILVHGLWGVPAHMEYLELQVLQLKQKCPETIATYKTNSHSKFVTYDGIDVNGKRVRDEIVQQKEELERGGNKVTKLSVIGYSLGGLILRYAIGILYKEGFFNEVIPVNYITFCTPHVGVPSPKKLKAIKLYDWLAPQFLATTGGQMFMRDSEVGLLDNGSKGKPLLVWMADPKSSFYKALASFHHLALYANAINDRRTAWYTALISRYDPFHSLHNHDPYKIQASYIKGYEPTVIDRTKPITYGDTSVKPEQKSDVKDKGGLATYLLRKWRWFKVFGSVVLLTPFWGLSFLINTIVQRYYHQRRVKTFFRDNTLTDMYHPNPSFAESLKDVVFDKQEQIVNSAYSAVETTTENERDEHLRQPETLLLTKDQEFIVENLNSLGWEKYPVIIRNTNSTHAAAIHRHQDPNFGEGKLVVKHFIDNVFCMD